MFSKPLGQSFWRNAMGVTLSSRLKFNSSSRMVFAAALFSTNDASNSGLSWWHVGKQTSKMIANRHLMKSLFHLINEIDDIVDGMSADERLAAGDADVGNTMSQFLMNEDVCVPAYHETIKKIGESGLVSYEEEVAFSNLYAVLIREGARAEKQHLLTGSVRSREGVTEANLRLAEVVGVHVLQHGVANPEVQSLSKERGLLYGDIPRIFPDAAALSRLAEMIDDMGDVFVDLENEIKTGIIAPNTVLCKLHARGNLYDNDGNLNPEMAAFYERHKNDRETILFHQYPEILQEAMGDLGDDFMSRAATLSPRHRDFLTLWWDVTVEDGLRSTVHPDVVFKAQRHAKDTAKTYESYERQL